MLPETERLANAINGPDPTSAVPALARALRAEGMSQREMYRLFVEQQQRLAGDHPGHDAVVDALDLIWGGPWAKGRALFDVELTDVSLKRE